MRDVFVVRVGEAPDKFERLVRWIEGYVVNRAIGPGGARRAPGFCTSTRGYDVQNQRLGSSGRETPCGRT